MQPEQPHIWILDTDKERSQVLRRTLASEAATVSQASSQDELFQQLTANTNVLIAAVSACLPNLLAFTTQLVEVAADVCLILYQEEPCADFSFDALSLVNFPEDLQRLRELLGACSRGELLPISFANLTDTLELLRLEKQSALLVLRQDDEVGELYVQQGELVHVSCGALTGMPALEKLFSWDHVTLEERAWQPPGEPVAQLSQESLPSTSALLLQESFSPTRVAPTPAPSLPSPETTLSSHEAAELLLSVSEDVSAEEECYPVAEPEDLPHEIPLEGEEYLDAAVEDNLREPEALQPLEQQSLESVPQESETVDVSARAADLQILVPVEPQGEHVSENPSPVETAISEEPLSDPNELFWKPKPTSNASPFGLAADNLVPTALSSQGLAEEVAVESSFFDQNTSFFDEFSAPTKASEEYHNTAVETESPSTDTLSDGTQTASLEKEEVALSAIETPSDTADKQVLLEDNESWLASFQSLPAIEPLENATPNVVSSPFEPSVEITGGFWMQFPEEAMLNLPASERESTALAAPIVEAEKPASPFEVQGAQVSPISSWLGAEALGVTEHSMQSVVLSEEAIVSESVSHEKLLSTPIPPTAEAVQEALESAEEEESFSQSELEALFVSPESLQAEEQTPWIPPRHEIEEAEVVEQTAEVVEQTAEFAGPLVAESTLPEEPAPTEPCEQEVSAESLEPTEALVEQEAVSAEAVQQDNLAPDEEMYPAESLVSAHGDVDDTALEVELQGEAASHVEEVLTSATQRVEDHGLTSASESTLAAATEEVVGAQVVGHEAALVETTSGEEHASSISEEAVDISEEAVDKSEEAVDISEDSFGEAHDASEESFPEDVAQSSSTDALDSDELIEGQFAVSADTALPVVGIEPSYAGVEPLLPTLSATLAAAAANETLWESTVQPPVSVLSPTRGLETLLEELLEEIPGAIHVAVLERESGLPLGLASAEQVVAAEEVLAYYAELWSSLESSAWFSTMGTECLVNTDSFALLLRPMGQEFLLGLVLHRKSNLGIGRSIVRKSTASFLELLPGVGSS